MHMVCSVGGGGAAGSQLGRLSTQSGAALSSRQPSSVQQQAAHALSSRASVEAAAGAAISTSKQSPHNGVCVVNPRATMADAAAEVAATLPPLPKAAGHKHAFGSEHRLLGLMRRHGSFAAKFMEADYTARTCRAEVAPLPHLDFAAPSASALELLATGMTAAALPLVPLEEQEVSRDMCYGTNVMANASDEA